MTKLKGTYAVTRKSIVLQEKLTVGQSNLAKTALNDPTQ